MTTQQVWMTARWALLGALLSSSQLGAADTGPANAADRRAPAAAVIDAAQYASLQEALDAVPAGGGLVKLPPGRFEITAPLVLSHSETRVIGSGAATCLVNCNQEGQPALFEENQDALRCADSFNLTMTGNNLDDHRRHGVVIENTYGSVVSGNMIEECEGTAIILDRDCYGITLSANVLADNFGGGIDLRDAHGCAVSANTFTIDWVRGLIVGPASGRITVTGNNFSDSYLGEQTRRQATQNLATGVLLDGARDVVVSGNQFSGLDGPAVEARGDCRRLAVTGNICVGVSRSTSGSQPALDVAGARDSVLQNNITLPGDEPVVPNAAAEAEKK